MLGSIQPQPLDYEADGTLDLDRVAAAIKPDDSHFARTRLLCLENTQGGRALPMDYLDARARFRPRAQALAASRRCARVQRRGEAPSRRARDRRWFDTVSVCLSKGLGAPVGSVLCGSRDLMAKARRWRKVLGGGMRQAGVLGRGGGLCVAAQRHSVCIRTTRTRGRWRRRSVKSIHCEIDYGPSQTNMLYLAVEPTLAEPLRQFLKQRGILIGAGHIIRLVTHLDVDRGRYPKVASAVREFLAQVRTARPAAA